MLVLDGNVWAWRSHFATPYLEYGGLLTGVLHTSLTTLASFPRIFERQRVIIAWDGRKNWRKGVMPEYKAHRHVTEAEQERYRQVYRQIDILREILRLVGVAQVHHETLEADDWAGILSARALRGGDAEVLLVSSDKDWFQLLGPRVSQVRSWRGTNTDVWTAERLEKEFGVPPARWPEHMALTGDPTDNIPKTRVRVGPKTASKMLAAGKLQLTPEERETFERNLKVTTLLRELPEGVTLRECFDRPYEPGKKLKKRRKKLKKILDSHNLTAVWLVRRFLWDLGEWG